jgi:signal transduction histidine kinase
MNAAARSATPITERPDLDGSLPRWDRLLLAMELGSAGLDRRSARDWFVDSVAFAFAVLAAASVTITHRAQVSTTMVVLNAALSVPACLSLWARRRHPLGVAWLTVALAAASSASVHAAQVAIFSAAIHARPRRALEATGGAIVATGVACAIYLDAGFFAVWTADAIAALAFGSFIRVRRELVDRLETEQQLRVHDARLTERARIAREMHDVLAHRISLLSVHAGALEVSTDASREEIVQAAGVIRTSARAAQEELREVLGILRADPGSETAQPPQPTIADVGHLVEQNRQAGMDVTLVDELSDLPVPALAGRTIYRVLQEALTNARKHAFGQPVSISLTGAPGELIHVEVVNHGGSGGSIDKRLEQVGAGTGLIGLAERLSLAKGTLEHRPLADGGFRLSATLPWNEAAAGGPGGRL